MQLDALQPGARLGDLEIVGQLGRGGMGVVYEARDLRIGRRVAIKVPTRELLQDGSAAARFDREARAAAAVVHPNVVTVFGVAAIGGWPYLVLELVPGGSLRGRLKTGGALGWREACAVARDVALGLEAVHGAGLIHRDLKPENVLLDGQGRAKITDFGIVRQASGGEDLTKTGQFLGTAAYMSPEQIDSARKVGPGADLYALGCVIHELVAGAPPFPGTSYDVLAKHLQRTPPALRASASGDADVPPALEALVRRLLAKHAEERPASAREVVDALSALLDGTAGRRGRRSVLPLVGVGGVALAAAGAIAWSVIAGPAVPVAPATTDVAPVATTAPVPPVATEPTPKPEPAPPVADERLPFELRPVALAAGAFAGTPGKNVSGLVHDRQRGFLTGDVAGGLYTWDETGRPDVALPGACTDHPRVAASAGRVLTASLLLGEAEVTVWEWQVGTLRRLRSFEHGLVDDLAAAVRDKHRRLWSVAISADGALGLVSATTSQVAIYDLETGTRRATLSGAADQPALALSQDGRWAFAGDRAGRLLAWDLALLPQDWPALDVLVHPVAKVNDNKGTLDVAVSANGDTVVTLGTDRRVVLTRRGAPRTVGTHGAPGNYPKTVALSPDARLALTGDKVELNLWDLAADRLLGRAAAHKVEQITFLDERRFATSGVSGVQLWTIE